MTVSASNNSPDAPPSVAGRCGLARVMTNGEMVFKDDYKPKNIMLTGGAGFIGSHVAILLAKKYPEYKVCSIVCSLVFIDVETSCIGGMPRQASEDASTPSPGLWIRSPCVETRLISRRTCSLHFITESSLRV